MCCTRGRWTSSAPQWRVPASWSGWSTTPIAARVSRSCVTPWVRQHLLRPAPFLLRWQVAPSAGSVCMMPGGHVTLQARRLLCLQARVATGAGLRTCWRRSTWASATLCTQAPRPPYARAARCRCATSPTASRRGPPSSGGSLTAGSGHPHPLDACAHGGRGLGGCQGPHTERRAR